MIEAVSFKSSHIHVSMLQVKFRNEKNFSCMYFIP